MKNNNNVCNGSNGALYVFGAIGAAFYFISKAVGFWAVMLALLKAFVWPGVLVYELLKFLQI